MKKILFILLGVIGFASIAFASQPILNSWQIGQSPANGYYLKTNGFSSSWAPVSGGSISTSTPVNANSGLAFWTSANTLSGTTSPTVGYITATSSLDTNYFAGNINTGSNYLINSIPLSTTNIPEGTNLYYTNTRVSANANVVANTTKVGITTSQSSAITANTTKVTESTTATTPLVLTGYDMSIPVATSLANGYLSSTDWSTFNSKLSSYTETDPIFTASPANSITAGDITNLGNLSGTNTGDQNLSGLVPYTGATSNVNLGINTLYTTGRIGIGTSTPYAPLSVIGQVVASYFNATSTTATSTFANGLDITGGCIAVNGSCISTSGSGTVTSVGMTTPVGLSVTGTPITGAGTLALSLSTGYNIPLTTSTNNWNTAYTNRITSATYPLSISLNNISTVATSTLGLLVNSFASPNISQWTNDSGYLSGITATTPLSGSGTAGSPLVLSTAGTWSGNAGTATKITTARTIAGVLFDGTANIALNNNAITNGAGYTTNTALSTWAGTANITTLGTITTGVWNGTSIADANIASASVWNAKEPALGNPTTDGDVLSSTIAGVRSWVTAGSGGGSPAGVNAGINVQTLTSDITLTAGTDPMYQYLDPSTASWTITLDTASASAGDRFVIKNNNVYSSTYSLTIYQGTTVLDTIYAQGIKVFIFDGTNWQGADNGVKDGNVQIGNNANGYWNGVAVGSYANSSDAGASVGYGANSYYYGVAVGYGANGSSYGSAIGAFANGSIYGSALGFYAGNGQTGSQNINIGQYVTSPTLAGNQQLNIGNVLYGTGMYNGTSVSSVPVVGGMIGIGKVPTQALDVVGNGLFSGTLTASNLSGTNTGDQIVITTTQAGNIVTNNAKVTESTTVTAPLSLTGYNISLAKANATTNGYLASADWNTFNNKLGTPIISSLATNAVPLWNGTALANSVITSAVGNVGIGMTNPLNRLSVGATDLTGANIVSGGGIAIYASSITNAPTATSLILDQQLGGVARIMASGVSTWNANLAINPYGGNVGIGTAAPTQKLTVAGGNIKIDNTTHSALNGIIYKGTTPFISNFNYGLNAGGIATIGQNTFVGLGAGNLTMGSTATANYQGSYNTAIGFNVFHANTTGRYNTANGVNALTSNTTGYYNTAISVNSLQSNTTGYSNTANGLNALQPNTTGYSNTAIGVSAGNYIADGTTGNTTSNSSTYLGMNTKALANGDTNETVIGYNAIGNGSNSVTLGNTSVTKTILQGNVGIGTGIPQATLDVAGTIRAKGYTVATLPTGVVGMRAYVTDATTPTYLGALTGSGTVTVPVFFNGSAWVSD